MIRDGNRAGDVIQRLRALTKKTDPQNAPLDINDVINDVVGLVLPEVLSHRIRLKLDLDTALNPIIGDRVQLQQVIINLVVNCIEAMANVAKRQRELMINGRVLVLVRDSDVGIDAEMLDRVFNPFFTTKADGMGMGLSICRSIIEAHGGKLWASSDDEVGFSVHRSICSCGGVGTRRLPPRDTSPQRGAHGFCRRRRSFIARGAEQPATIGGFTRRTVRVRP
jgi:signal transduction histidine kinase